VASFYCYRERNFVAILANELQVGDELAYGYGGDLKYGAIPIEEIIHAPGGGILLQYTLPVGALAQSTATTSIAVYWKGKTPDIAINQDIHIRDRMLILRK